MSNVIGGSLQNRLIERQRGMKPQIGMGVTQILWSDRYPFEVVAIKDTRHITVREMNAKLISGSWMDECQEYEYESNENGRTFDLFLTNKGRWVARIGREYIDGYTWYVGNAEMYRDPHF